jgi:hypothetical protein
VPDHHIHDLRPRPADRQAAAAAAVEDLQPMGFLLEEAPCSGRASSAGLRPARNRAGALSALASILASRAFTRAGRWGFTGRVQARGGAGIRSPIGQAHGRVGKSRQARACSDGEPRLPHGVPLPPIINPMACNLVAPPVFHNPAWRCLPRRMPMPT